MAVIEEGAKGGALSFLGGLGIPGAIGSTLLGSLLSVGSERERRKKLKEQYDLAIQPLRDRFSTANVGLSAAEGGLLRSTTDRTLTSLASRGVLDSSIAAGEVAGAVAPIEAAAAGRRDSLAERLASAQFQIAENTSAPGYAGAVGGALGDIGGFLGLLEGVKRGYRGGFGEAFG
jgi:hypothetical protein